MPGSASVRHLWCVKDMLMWNNAALQQLWLTAVTMFVAQLSVCPLLLWSERAGLRECFQWLINVLLWFVCVCDFDDYIVNSMNSILYLLCHLIQSVFFGPMAVRQCVFVSGFMRLP